MTSANETILHVDLNKLEENLTYLKSKLKPQTKIIAVVKAFAYGHGDLEVSRRLEQLNVFALWVSDFEEGLILRRSGIKTKIIVANPGIKSYNEIIKYKLDVVLYNHKLLDLYCSNKKPVNVHVKFNTGMNRYGFDEKDLESVCEKLKKNSFLRVKSVCSHLASANQKNDALKQIRLFEKITTQKRRKRGGEEEKNKVPADVSWTTDDKKKEEENAIHLVFGYLLL